MLTDKKFLGEESFARQRINPKLSSEKGMLDLCSQSSNLQIATRNFPSTFNFNSVQDLGFRCHLPYKVEVSDPYLENIEIRSAINKMYKVLICFFFLLVTFLDLMKMKSITQTVIFSSHIGNLNSHIELRGVFFRTLS